MIVRSTLSNLLIDGVWLDLCTNVTVSDSDGASYLKHDGVVEVVDPKAAILAEIQTLEKQENLPLS
jgi:hypothetical protein